MWTLTHIGGGGGVTRISRSPPGFTHISKHTWFNSTVYISTHFLPVGIYTPAHVLTTNGIRCGLCPECINIIEFGLKKRGKWGDPGGWATPPSFNIFMNTTQWLYMVFPYSMPLQKKNICLIPLCYCWVLATPLVLLLASFPWLERLKFEQY